MISRDGVSTVALWLICHYPGTRETKERIDTVRKLYEKTRLPVFVFASALARYTKPVEDLLKEELVQSGVRAEDIIRSADVEGIGDCLDTVQEVTTSWPRPNVWDSRC